ncbi:MAG: ATP-binding protein [Oscillospiraceae bacterium]|nr:ATP-binding protein [Oscillospiraceae bacterium]
MRTELTKRIFIACMIVFLMSFGLVLYMLNSYLAKRNLAELQDKALYISSMIEQNSWDFLKNMQNTSNTRTTIIASDGTVVFDSMFPLEQLENHSNRIEFQEALQYGSGSSERYSESLLKKTANYALCLENNYIIRVSMNQDSIWVLLIQMLTPMLAIIFSMMILSILLAFSSTKKIMLPINKLDPENPDDRNIYDEMKPFVRKLIVQNQQIYHQMEQLQNEHKKQDAIRREFTANVSHELKTPLTSISGFAEIIRNGYVQEQDISHFADNIYKETQRMISLVNDILKLSKLEDGNINIYERESVNLLELCQNIQERLALHAEKKQIAISCEGEAISIIGIPIMLDEIIYNICDNAIKYNFSGGYVKILVKKQDTHAVIEISDNGIGIPEKDQERVFERFYRVNKSHSKEVGGTGLGLSIVKHGMALHHAKIILESQENKGTCMKLYFPV